MMHKNSALLSIGAALLLPLFFVDPGHAFQIEKRQAANTLMAGEMKGPANSPNTQVSNKPNPCTDAARGRTGAPCKRHSPPGSIVKVTDGSLYTDATMLR